MCLNLAHGLYIFASRNLKTEVIMWIAVIIFVSLSVEVLSYLSGGEISTEPDKDKINE